MHVLGEQARLAGDLKTARRYLVGVDEGFSDPRSKRSMGRLLEAEGRYEEAERAYEEFLGMKGPILAKDCSLIWIHGHLDLARCAARRGSSAKAARFYRAFIALTDNAKGSPLVEQARIELSSLPS